MIEFLFVMDVSVVMGWLLILMLIYSRGVGLLGRGICKGLEVFLLVGFCEENGLLGCIVVYCFVGIIEGLLWKVYSVDVMRIRRWGDVKNYVLIIC